MNYFIKSLLSIIILTSCTTYADNKQKESLSTENSLKIKLLAIDSDSKEQLDGIKNGITSCVAYKNATVLKELKYNNLDVFTVSFNLCDNTNRIIEFLEVGNNIVFNDINYKIINLNNKHLELLNIKSKISKNYLF
jgi:hypothetical protein